ncbi:MAG TPA: sensor histidine kinase [Gemmatimonadaceae bacterium]
MPHGGGLVELELSTYPMELAGELADRLRTVKQELVTRWLDRIRARVAIPDKRVFPTHELLNHVPLLIEGIAGYLRRPDKDIDSGAPVVAKAMELGALRHEQGFDAYEILKEYEMLGEIIFDFIADCADQIPETVPRRDFLACWQRISQGVELIRQATMSHFLRLSDEEVTEREERLRKFNRTVAHELKNRVHAVASASAVLTEPWLDEKERLEFAKIVSKNADGLRRVLKNLELLSQPQMDPRHRRNILLPEVATEAVRELREAADASGVEVRIADSLPSIEVDAATVELCLMNYVSNAIKYSDAQKGKRWVSIDASVEGPDTRRDKEVVIRVSDNGIGVPADKRDNLFQEFFRAHDETVTEADGSGLGLSIVKETVESIGGRAWAEFPGESGSVFAFAIPSRREEDKPALADASEESLTAD